MAEHDPSKTEQATGRRKSEAKKKGQIALSREVPTATVLLGGVLIIYALSAGGTARLTAIMRQWFSRTTEIGAHPMTTDTVFDMASITKPARSSQKPNAMPMRPIRFERSSGGVMSAM